MAYQSNMSAWHRRLFGAGGSGLIAWGWTNGTMALGLAGAAMLMAAITGF